MNANITRQDVIRYLADALDEDRRQEVEAARQTDPRVARWLDELGPADELTDNLPPELTPEVLAKMRALVAVTYFGTVEEKAAPVISPDSIQPGSLHLGENGAMAYRRKVPDLAPADTADRSMKAITIPLIEPDFKNGQLMIRQWTENLESPLITVRPAKINGPGIVELYQPLEFELIRRERLDGKTYWYGEVSIADLVPSLAPGDDMVFYVEPATTESKQK